MPVENGSYAGRFNVWCCRVGTRWHRSHRVARTKLIRAVAGDIAGPSLNPAWEYCSVDYEGENCQIVAAECNHAAAAPEEQSCSWVAYATLECIPALGNQYMPGFGDTELEAVSEARNSCERMGDDLCECTGAVTACCVLPEAGGSWSDAYDFAPCNPKPGS